MYRDIPCLQYKSHSYHRHYTETNCVFCMLSASVQKAFVFHANKTYQSRMVLDPYRDHMMRYTFFNVSNLAGLPDGGGVSGDIGAGLGGTVIAAVGSPQKFRGGGDVTMFE